MVQVMKDAVLIGIGALDKTKDLVRELRQRGEANQGPAAKLVKEVLAKGEAACRDCMQAVLDQAGVATKADLRRLEERLQERPKDSGPRRT